MPNIKVLTCTDAGVPSGSLATACPSANQIYQEVQLADDTFLQEALYNVDVESVSAIFGGALLLFVVGIGAGWVYQSLRIARL